MPKSRRLTLANVRAVLRLVGECRDLGYDPGEWGRHLHDGLCRLTGTRVGVGGELRAPGRGAPGELVTLTHAGMGPAESAAVDDFVRHPGFGAHPVSAVLDGWAGRVVARTRRQLVPDTDWYRSLCYEQFHRPMERDHCLVSPYRLSDGSLHLITLHRTAGEHDFSPREQRLLLLAHVEIGRLMGPVLVRADDQYSPARLPPRVRETLACLLDGDSEKQVALRMGLSRTTVHQYVTALYRHYQVASRAELLARVLRRPEPGGP
jgi:DNA-binding CsgD family transcriptional regulator